MIRPAHYLVPLFLVSILGLTASQVLLDHTKMMMVIMVVMVAVVVVKDATKIYKFNSEGVKHPRADFETDPCNHDEEHWQSLLPQHL